MKQSERITVALALAAAVLAFMSGAGMVSAQTTTLTCLPSTSTVAPGANVTFFVSGASGPYTFFGGTVASTTTATPSFTTNFANTGTNTFTVTAGGQSANCSVNVQPATAGAVACVLPTANLVTGTPLQFSATGGNGTYTWSATDMTITNPNGNIFTATYSVPGIHTLTVTSNGQSANCTFLVTGSSGTPSGNVACSTLTPTVNAGTPVVFNATGGNGTYTWSASDLTINNPLGTSFTATYSTPGVHILSVASGGQSSTCSVTVLATSVPGLPNTGFAPVH